MPMSQAAMSGMRAFGRGWRFQVSFSGLAEQIGDWEEGVTPVSEIEDTRRVIIDRTKAVLKNTKATADMIDDIERALDDLEMVDPEVCEIRGALNELYDQFDYYRVCVVR